MLKIPAGGVYNVIEAKCSKIAFILKMDGGRGREEGGGRGGREGEGGRRKRGERREGRRMRGGGGRGGKGRETGRERREEGGEEEGEQGRVGRGGETGRERREGDREWGGNNYDQEVSARYLWQSTHYFNPKQHFKWQNIPDNKPHAPTHTCTRQ